MNLPVQAILRFTLCALLCCAPSAHAQPWPSKPIRMVAPVGTPKEIVARLSAETAKILSLAEVRERFLAQGVEPVGSTPEQFAAFIEAEMPRWANAVRSAGIKPD